MSSTQDIGVTPGTTKPTTSQTIALYLAGIRILVFRYWRKIFGSSEPPPVDWHDVRLLVVGLDGAGKSALVRRAGDASAQIDAALPATSGFAVKTLTLQPHWRCEAWEIGGAAAVRPFWPRYATGSEDGLAWVVDGSAAARLEESARALADLLRAAPGLRRLPLLVVVSKADLPAATLSVERVRDGLGLEGLAAQGLCTGPRKVVSVSAATGQSLEESLCWLCAGGDERA